MEVVAPKKKWLGCTNFDTHYFNEPTLFVPEKFQVSI